MYRLHALPHGQRTLTRTRLAVWMGRALALAVAGAMWLGALAWTDARPAWALPGWLMLAVGLGSTLALWPRLHRSMKMQELTMAGSHDGLFEWDPLSKHLVVGRRLLEILGYTEDFLSTSDDWLQIVHPDDRDTFNRAVTAHLKGQTDHFYCEYRVKAQNGDYLWLAARGLVAQVKGPTARLMAGSVTNITDRVQREQHMQRLARTDQLTGLPNRRGLLERFPAILSQAQRQGGSVGVLFIDVDRFKDVNDTLGHRAGDDVLRVLSQRLPAALRAYDLLTRQGGDELIVLLPDLADAAEAQRVAHRVLMSIGEPVQIDDHRLQLGASIGLALFPQDGNDPDTLLRRADLAMYEAKAQGGHQWRAYTPELDQRLSERVTLEHRLLQAIEQEQITLHFQPQFGARTGQLVGAEALVRWTDRGTPVRPDVFVRVAEDCGLIDVLGRRVMDLALRQLAHWQPQLPTDFRLAVNLSPRQFRSGAVDVEWLQAMALHGVQAQALALEVTESVLLDPDGKAIAALARLHHAGIEIALDDFGTGYSSLSYLHVLELDVLKIDKSFVSGLDPTSTLDRSDRSHAVVGATLAMAHKLGYRVVAEGVETPEQRTWLQVQGCDILQGFLLGKPVSAAEFEAEYLSQ